MDPLIDLASRALAQHWGLCGHLKPLPGELDDNFRVTMPNGEEFLARIFSPTASPQAIDYESYLFAELATRAPHIPLQRLIPTRTGKLTCTFQSRIVRLTSWLPGIVWADGMVNSDVVRRRAAASLGQLLAKLDMTLQGLAHPHARHHHRWDLVNAPDHLPLVALIADQPKQTAVQAVLERFITDVEPRLAHLPRQIIHGDANDRNVLLDEDGLVSGLIDFGDSVSSWRINEVAIACAYAAIGADDPISISAALVAAYHEVSPFSEVEIDVLLDLIQTRYAMSICMAAHQIRENPTNDYLLISQNEVWNQLQLLRAANRALTIMRFRAACRLAAVAGGAHVQRWLEHNGHRCSPIMSRNMAPDRLTVLDLSVDANSSGPLTMLLDAALRNTTPIGRFGEDRDVYKTEAFATADPTERRTIHVGIDMFAPADEAILAPLDAVVVGIDYETVPLGFGAMLVLQHETDSGEPFWTVYGHLSRASMDSLHVGHRVRAGDVVARLGTPQENGGWPPHVHFQVMTDLCGWSVTEIIGVVTRSEWDLWRSVFLNPNLILGLQVDCSVIVTRSPEWLAKERKHVLGQSLSLAYTEPLKIVRGEGIHLVAESGERYLDMVNNVCHVGHCHPRVVAAGQRQMATLNTNTRYLHDYLVEYSRRLTDTLPGDLSVVFMVNSGSEANDLALRLARTFTANRDVITVDHVYHGNLTSIVDISPYKFAGPGGTGRADHVWVAEMPDLYRGRFVHSDADAGSKYARSVADQIDEIQARGRAPAAFFSEGILGTGGMLTLPDGYLKAAYAHVRAAGGLCVADEVQLGFGRVGSHMWAFEAEGVIPDIVTMGKPIGNGHPMAAVVTTPQIAQAFANGMEYFSTFGGNPVSAAIGLAVLDVIRDERLVHNAAVVGNVLMHGLHQIGEHRQIVGDVRGRGLFIGVELVRDRITKEPAAAELTAVVERMKAERVLLSSEGPHHNVLKIKPPIILSQDNAEDFLTKIDRTLGSIMEEFAM